MQHTRSPWDELIVAAGAAIPFGVCGLLVPFRTSFPNTDAALVLVVVVVAVAAFGRRLAGLAAAASAAVWFDFFLTVPYEHFTITRRDDIETTCLLLLVGAAVTELAVRGRRYRMRAETEARYLAAIDSASTPTTTTPARGASDIANRLAEVLSLRSAWFERSSFGGMPRLEPDGRVRMGERIIDAATGGELPTPIELLAQSNGRTYGRFVLEPTPGVPVPVEARRVATILASQTAAALTDESLAHRR